MKLDKERQIIAVEKVLEEMKKAEEFVSSWDASWLEQCLDAYSLSLYNTGMGDVQDIEEKYHNHYKLPNVYYPEERIGEPLRKTVLIDHYGNKHECEFGRIDWYGMNSHKFKRHFTFNNNGDITFEKMAKNNPLRLPRYISYRSEYNVLSNDFSIAINLSTRTSYTNKDENFVISLKNNILTKKINDVQIIEDLNTGTKIIKIIKDNDKNNNASVDFEAKLDPNENLKMATIIINTHKGNGKVNGTYRLDASNEKGIRANFYSRKGHKVDLTKNRILLEKTSNLMLAASNTKNSTDIIVTNFKNDIKNTILKNLSNRVISFDNSDFNMEALKQMEARIIEMLKSIKGEIPLYGLTERI